MPHESSLVSCRYGDYLTGLYVPDGERMLVISVCSDRGSGVFHLDRMTEGEIERLYDKLERSRLVFHNRPFDLHFLRDGHPQGRDLIEAAQWDTKPAIRVLQPGQPDTSLKPTAERLWGESATAPDRAMERWRKANRKKKSQMVEAPDEILEPYALQDARLTWRLFKLQRSLLEQDPQQGKLSELVARDLAFGRVLYAMEQRGLGWDRRRAREVAKWLRSECTRIAEKLPFKATKPAAATYYFDELDLVPTKLSLKTGKPSFDEETRAALIEQDAPYIREFDLHERYKRYASMWYDGWSNKVQDGRLHAFFRQTGTVSTRLSVERVQLQAIPHDYRLDLPDGMPTPRALIRPAAGKRLFELDVAQAEVRIASAVARCDRMLEIIEAGGDIHGSTCTDLFAIERDQSGWSKYRNIAKRVNFAMVYGVGVRTLQQQLWQHAQVRVSEGESRKYLSLHRRTYPEFVRAARVAEQRAAERGWVMLCSGVRRHFQPHEELHKAFNAVIQGGVAQAMQDAMIEVERRWPGVLLMQIHDSLLVEVPAEGGGRVLRGVRDTMQATFERYFRTRFVVDVKEWEEAA